MMEKVHSTAPDGEAPAAGAKANAAPIGEAVRGIGPTEACICQGPQVLTCRRDCSAAPRHNPTYYDLYNELIYAVYSKFPGESRHQTALRYIREAEKRATSGGPTNTKP